MIQLNVIIQQMENLLIKRKAYLIESTMKESDNHVSYKVSFKNRFYFAKKYNNFVDFVKEQQAYKDFKNYGIKNPKLLKVDKKNNILLYEFVDGVKALDAIAKNTIDDSWFEKLFTIYRFARFSKIDIDYRPEQFVMVKDELIYLQHDFMEQNSKYNLENYGLDFWLYGDVCIKHLKEFGYEIDKSRVLEQAEVNKKIVLLSIMKW